MTARSSCRFGTRLSSKATCLASLTALLASVAAVAAAQAAPATTAGVAVPIAAPRAAWITLGTSGGPAVQAERSQIANALVVDGAVYLFDVGNGVQRQLALSGLAERAVQAVFLSHHHLDHNADLGPILVTRWTFNPQPLPVIGPEGTRHLVEHLAIANEPTMLAGFPTGGPAKTPLLDLVRPMDLPVGLHEPQLVFEDAHAKVWAIGVDHFNDAPSVPLPRRPDAVAYRVEAGGRVFVFSGDTGPSPRLQRLMQGADVLVSEVVEPASIANLLSKSMAQAPAAQREAIIAGMRHNHLVPGEIGRMAAAAGVKQVVLTHFVPSPEQSLDTAAFTRDLQREFRGPVSLAKDLERF